jgi:hypothetical protein
LLKEKTILDLKSPLAAVYQFITETFTFAVPPFCFPHPKLDHMFWVQSV